MATTSRTLRVAFVLSLLASAQACLAEDEWFGGDKRAHFIGGLAVGGVVSAASGSIHPGLIAGCSVGVFGELIEVWKYGIFSGHVSAKDFAAECAGAVAGAYIGKWAAPNDRVDSASAKRGTEKDSWIGRDKVAHFTGGLIVSGIVTNYTDSATVGLLSGCAVGFGGEVIDAVSHGWNSKHVSAKDAIVGCVGGIGGAFAGVQIAPNRIVWTKQF